MTAAAERPPIGHPGTIGPQNSRMLDHMTVAYQRCLQIAEDGYTILDINLSGARPRIEIQPTRRCQALYGATARWGTDGRGRYARYVSLRYAGVQVEWTERG